MEAFSLRSSFSLQPCPRCWWTRATGKQASSVSTLCKTSGACGRRAMQVASEMAALLWLFILVAVPPQWPGTWTLVVICAGLETCCMHLHQDIRVVPQGGLCALGFKP